jgi:RNA polymerase sigma factor (sigma-70 family)
MTTGELTPVLRYIREVGGAAGPSDRQLLEHFVRRRDSGAFEALVRRHGPMVLGVCRRLLRDAHEAEDAFQATFLLLVRKARSLRQPERLGPWLHGVAYRTAVRARARAARRRAWDDRVEDLPARPTEDLLWRDLRPVLDDAINGLPSKYRLPFVLCYLEGMTNAQAAQHLGCPPGTVATRLARARARLRARLTRQGVAVGGLLGLALATRTASAVPPALLAVTVRATATGVIPAAVTTLMEGVCKAMFLDKMRMLVLTLAAFVAAGGAGLWTYRALAGEPPAREDEERRVTPPPLVEPVRSQPPPPVPAVAPPPVALDEASPAASYRTTNFVVTAPTRRCARLVAEAAEQQRRQQALRWLGKELPDWKELCRIRVNIPSLGFLSNTASEADGHATCFAFDNGKVTAQEMQLEGQLERILANSLPHEVTHTIFASHFRAPVPRWADEGAALLAEDEEEQQRHEKLMRRLLDTPERFLSLRRLLPMPDYPKDVMPLYVEGYALTRFLVERKDRQTFLAFVARGIRGDWDEAASRSYGFRNVKELERAWTTSLGREREEKADTGEASPPVGAQPVTGMVRVDEKGRLFLRLRSVVYRPVATRVRHDGRAETVTTYVPEVTVEQQLLDVDEADVYDLDGKRVEPRVLTAALTRETPVLVSTDGRKVDPYHLQLIKKGTLILVPPPPARLPPPAPLAPPAPPAVSGY